MSRLSCSLFNYELIPRGVVPFHQQRDSDELCTLKTHWPHWHLADPCTTSHNNRPRIASRPLGRVAVALLCSCCRTCAGLHMRRRSGVLAIVLHLHNCRWHTWARHSENRPHTLPRRIDATFFIVSRPQKRLFLDYRPMNAPLARLRDNLCWSVPNMSTRCNRIRRCYLVLW